MMKIRFLAFLVLAPFLPGAHAELAWIPGDPGFYMRSGPVSCQEFARFVAAGGYARSDSWTREGNQLRARLVDLTGKPGPRDWRDGKPPKGSESLPVKVNLHEAAAWARWSRTTLLSRLRWEAAARVIQGMGPYPWAALPTATATRGFWTTAAWGDRAREARHRLVLAALAELRKGLASAKALEDLRARLVAIEKRVDGLARGVAGLAAADRVRRLEADLEGLRTGLALKASRQQVDEGARLLAGVQGRTGRLAAAVKGLGKIEGRVEKLATRIEELSLFKAGIVGTYVTRKAFDELSANLDKLARSAEIRDDKLKDLRQQDATLKARLDAPLSSQERTTEGHLQELYAQIRLVKETQQLFKAKLEAKSDRKGVEAKFGSIERALDETKGKLAGQVGEDIDALKKRTEENRNMMAGLRETSRGVVDEFLSLSARQRTVERRVASLEQGGKKIRQRFAYIGSEIVRLFKADQPSAGKWTAARAGKSPAVLRTPDDTRVMLSKLLTDLGLAFVEWDMPGIAGAFFGKALELWKRNDRARRVVAERGRELFRPKGMVFVPAGKFVMGSDAGAPEEERERSVVVGTYTIDVNPVTNREFARFLAAAGQRLGIRPPAHWAGGRIPPGAGDHPVVGITHEEASHYARWMGKRLPTEREWERAARGKRGNLYPWGDDSPDRGPRRANYRTRRDPYPYTSPVGAFPAGISPVGCLDMAGNVAQWVTLPDQENTDKRLAKGGSWRSGAEGLRCSARMFHDKAHRDLAIGFRCVKDVAPGDPR